MKLSIKTLLLLLIAFAAFVYPQKTLKRKIVLSAHNFVYAGDFDGSTEYVYVPNPVNLDLNDTSRGRYQIDKDFENIQLYQSDFSAGIDGWIDVYWVSLTGNVDGVYGENDVLSIVVTDATKAARAQSKTIYVTKTNLDETLIVEFDYYIPATNSSQSFAVWLLNMKDDMGNGSTVGSWAHFRGTGVNPQGDNIAPYFQIQFTGTLANGDTIYIKNVNFAKYPDYTSNGNHSIDTTSSSPIAGSYSGQIIASGAGDNTTNYIGLDNTYFADLVTGEKYTYEFDTKDLYLTAGATMTVDVGTQSKTFNLSTTATTNAFTFVANAGDTLLKIYFNQADTVLIDNVNLYRVKPVTINVWVNIDSTTIDKHIIGYGINGGGWGANGYSVYYFNNQLVLDIKDKYGIRYSYGTIYTGEYDKYNLITAVYADSIRLYINGNYIGSTDLSTTGAVVGSSYKIAVGSFLGSRYFSRYIGQAKIDVDYDMPSSEIQQNYNRGLKGKDFIKNGYEVAWYKWKGGDNTTFLKDWSNNGNDAIGVNFDVSDDQVKLKGGYK